MQNDEKAETAATHDDLQPAAGTAKSPTSESKPVEAGDKSEATDADYPDPAIESGGPKGPDPTRYGDWERKGILSDF